MQRKNCEELFSRYGKEFGVILDKSDYNGPVLFFDLRRQSLWNLNISYSEELVASLVEMFDYFICEQEQMNSFILCDDVARCRFYSTNQILRLLNGQNFNLDYNWHKIFPKAEIHGAVPNDAHANFALAEWYAQHGNSFACMTFKEIPISYKKFDEEILGVENYLPEVMYFLMENIKKGCYPNVDYPYLYKPNVVAGFLPELVYWHLDTGSTNWKESVLPQQAVNSQKKKNCDELFAKYKKEFSVVLKKSDYHGPVLVFDLRRKSLEKLGIPLGEALVPSLIEMFDFFIREQEQMNSFILCDEVADCRFYSTNQILRLLSEPNDNPDYQWHRIFKDVKINEKISDVVYGNLADSEACVRFSCMTFKDIPESYQKFNEKIFGVENYLPEVLYFVMENIKNGRYPKVNYPYLYKPNVVAGFLPELFYWHLETGTTNRETEKVPQQAFYPTHH